MTCTYLRLVISWNKELYIYLKLFNWYYYCLAILIFAHNMRIGWLHLFGKKKETISNGVNRTRNAYLVQYGWYEAKIHGKMRQVPHFWPLIWYSPMYWCKIYQHLAFYKEIRLFSLSWGPMSIISHTLF